MIARAQHCNRLETCLKNYAAQFQNVKHGSISREGLIKLYATICNNTDALAACYNQQIIQDCSKLPGFQTDLKTELTNACARKDDLSETSRCILNRTTVSQAITDCSNKIKGDICSISKYIGCIESAMKGQCEEKIGLFPAIRSRLSFCDVDTAENQPTEKTANNNQCAVFCSGSKILALLCFLLFLIQIVK